MVQIHQLADLLWDRIWFPNQSILLQSDSKSLEKLGLSELSAQALDRAVEERKPVEEFVTGDDLPEFGDSLRLAVQLYRMGRKEEARQHIEATERAVRQYEIKAPDAALAAALFFRAQALVVMGDAEAAVVAARYAVEEMGRLNAQTTSGGRHEFTAYADCLYGYLLSRSYRFKVSDVGGGKASIAYLARGIVHLEGLIRVNPGQEPRLLWALELLAEALGHEDKKEAAYFVRLELHRRWSRDALRVQAVFDVALAHSLQKRAALAKSLGLAAEERELESEAKELLSRAQQADVAAREVPAPSVHTLLQRLFMVTLSSVIDKLDSVEG